MQSVFHRTIAMGAECIVPISTCERIKIYIFSMVCAFWLFAKRILGKVWRSKSKHGHFEKRGSPPFCLLDTSLGQHSYVKLKVRQGDATNPLVA